MLLSMATLRKLSSSSSSSSPSKSNLLRLLLLKPLNPPPSQTLNPRFSHPPKSPFNNLIKPSHFHTPQTLTLTLRHLSSQSQSPQNDSSKSKPEPDFKHQEIEGPTVERDLSPLADETRDVTHRLMKTMYQLSNLLAFLALSQLAIGAWISYSNASQTGSTMALSTVVGFGLPFSMAFLLRQSLKSMRFFHKMEQIGRLQLLTSIMQIKKLIHLFFLRIRVVTILCLVCSPLPFVSSLFSNSSS